MFEIKAWLADADGYFAGELETTSSPHDFATFADNAKANGQTAIDKGIDPAATRPPDRPLPPEIAALRAKAQRYDELRAKGYANLTAAEKDEATALRFDLGL
jgi:hypothetical protein